MGDPRGTRLLTSLASHTGVLPHSNVDSEPLTDRGISRCLLPAYTGCRCGVSPSDLRCRSELSAAGPRLEDQFIETVYHRLFDMYRTIQTFFDMPLRMRRVCLVAIFRSMSLRDLYAQISRTEKYECGHDSHEMAKGGSGYSGCSSQGLTVFKMSPH